MSETIYEALRESHEIQRSLCRRLLRTSARGDDRQEIFTQLRIELAADEPLDFIVDAGTSDNSDSIQADFVLKNAAGQRVGNSRDEFSGPAMDPWVAYAQILLISNEFMFVD